MPTITPVKFQGITAEVLVVTSFDELQRRASEARGKIVVYNQPYVNYSKTVQYRTQGAVEAAKVGALASLIRSVASFSIYRDSQAVFHVAREVEKKERTSGNPSYNLGVPEELSSKGLQISAK
ncbi:hypothetical protein P7K49_026909 [Saguinus oedipus]|uniref:RNase H type-1 domain-containing protein n=1 Tax=Saguinus oedipus TaxID=9490 RepID=A0ABQ9UEJ8_SAGOE|nr:hypothetical protein P7K49_026909 [Saguinus oedipus]